MVSLIKNSFHSSIKNYTTSAVSIISAIGVTGARKHTITPYFQINEDMRWIKLPDSFRELQPIYCK